MVKIRIKEVETENDLKIYNQMTKYAFAPSPSDSAKARNNQESQEAEVDYFKESSRYLLYEDKTPVSSLHSIPMTQNVRGKIFGMMGIAGVSTYPEYRKKGYITKLMQHALNKSKSNDQVLSTLFPFRQSFYGRFGYINFPQARSISFNPAHLHDIENYEFTGDIERYIVGDQIDRYFDFIKKYQKTRHGFGNFKRSRIQKLEKSEHWVVFVVVNGEDRGMMTFSTTGFEKELKVNLFLYLDSNAKYVLLDHIWRHADQFSEVKMRVFAHERPETWVYDLKPTIKNRDWVPSAMGRILNISKLSGMTVGEGNISINVTDRYCEWNNGNWEFNCIENKLKVNKTSSYDVKVTSQALSALIYGGYSIGDLINRGWISSSEKNDLLLRIFPSELPTLWTTF